MTLAEIKAMSEGKKEMLEAEMKRDKWLLWQSEALRRQKRLISLQMWMSERRAKARKLEGEEAEQYRSQHADIIEQYNQAKAR